jgi:hypothetical protein
MSRIRLKSGAIGDCTFVLWLADTLVQWRVRVTRSPGNTLARHEDRGGRRSRMGRG